MRTSALLALLALRCSLWQPEEPVIEYTVVRGDTLSAIARGHGVTVDDLRLWNRIEGDLIEVGQVLVIREAGAAPAPRRSVREKTPTSSSSEPADLVMPAEQDCIEPPQAEPGDPEEASYTGSAGLSPAQVSAALDAFLPRLDRCSPGPGSAGGVVKLQFNVACTGRVAAVTVLDDGGLPDALVTCLRDTLVCTPFPAHDLPDGEVFTYPLTVSW